MSEEKESQFEYFSQLPEDVKAEILIRTSTSQMKISKELDDINDKNSTKERKLIYRREELIQEFGKKNIREFVKYLSTDSFVVFLTNGNFDKEDPLCKKMLTLVLEDIEYTYVFFSFLYKDLDQLYKKEEHVVSRCCKSFIRSVTSVMIVERKYSCAENLIRITSVDLAKKVFSVNPICFYLYDLLNVEICKQRKDEVEFLEFCNVFLRIL